MSRRRYRVVDALSRTRGYSRPHAGIRMRLPGARRARTTSSAAVAWRASRPPLLRPRGRASCSCRGVLAGNASTEVRVNLEGAKEGGHNRHFVESSFAEDLLLLNFWQPDGLGRPLVGAPLRPRRVGGPRRPRSRRHCDRRRPRHRGRAGRRPPARAHPRRRREPLRGAAPRARARAGRVDGGRVSPRRGSAVALEGRRGARRRERLLSTPLVTARLKGFDWSLVQPARTLDATVGAGVPSVTAPLHLRWLPSASPHDDMIGVYA